MASDTHNRREWLVRATGLALSVPVLTHAEDVSAAKNRPIVVIVSGKSPLTNVSLSKLRRVFLARPTEDATGRRFVPFNQPPGSGTRVAFDKLVLDMDEEEVGRFWIDRKIRGQPGAPRAIASVALIRRVVAKLPGAICYIRSNQLDSSVKALRVDGKSHKDDKYPLRVR